MVNQNNYKVYMHTNKINGKKYIGITGRSVEERWLGGNGYKTGSFRNAINKYGWGNFDHEVLCEGLTEGEANEKEIFYIKQYKTRDRKHGYNIHIGGSVKKGYQHTEEAKKKISIASKKMSIETRRLARSKQIITESHKKHMSEARLGMKFSEEHLKNLSLSHVGNPGYWEGKERPEETRIKICEKLSKNKVICVETGVIYRSVKEASRLTGIASANIYKWCKGGKPRFSKITFKYYTEGE